MPILSSSLYRCDLTQGDQPGGDPLKPARAPRTLQGAQILPLNFTARAMTLGERKRSFCALKIPLKEFPPMLPTTFALHLTAGNWIQADGIFIVFISVKEYQIAIIRD
jgi:hypothetical protein